MLGGRMPIVIDGCQAKKMTNKQVYNDLNKVCTSEKDYSTSLAYYLDRKTSVRKEIVSILTNVYHSGCLIKTDGSIDEEVLPKELWNLPISIVVDSINGQKYTGNDTVYCTVLQLARSINGVLSTDDPELSEMDLIEMESSFTMRELIEVSDDKLSLFESGVLKSLGVTIPFTLRDANGSIYNPGVYFIEDLEELNLVLWRDKPIPKLTINVPQTLNICARDMNSNRFVTMLFDMLGTNSNISDSDVLDRANSILGEATSSTVEYCSEYYGIATNNSLTIQDRITALTDAFLNDTNVISNDQDSIAYDDQELQLTFSRDNYTGTPALSMWSTISCDNVFANAISLIANARKLVFKAQFTLLKSAVKGVKRLWTKYVEPSYESKDFVKSDKTDVDGHVDIPLVSVENYQFSTNNLINNVCNTLSERSSVVYNIKDSDISIKLVNDDISNPTYSVTPVKDFINSIETVTSYSNKYRMITGVTKWEVLDDVKQGRVEFFGPVDQHDQLKDYLVCSFIDKTGQRYNIGDVGRSYFLSADTVDMSFSDGNRDGWPQGTVFPLITSKVLYIYPLLFKAECGYTGRLSNGDGASTSYVLGDVGMLGGWKAYAFEVISGSDIITKQNADYFAVDLVKPGKQGDVTFKVYCNKSSTSSMLIYNFTVTCKEGHGLWWTINEVTYVNREGVSIPMEHASGIFLANDRLYSNQNVYTYYDKSIIGTVPCLEFDVSCLSDYHIEMISNKELRLVNDHFKHDYVSIYVNDQLIKVSSPFSNSIEYSQFLGLDQWNCAVSHKIRLDYIDATTHQVECIFRCDRSASGFFINQYTCSYESNGTSDIQLVATMRSPVSMYDNDNVECQWNEDGTELTWWTVPITALSLNTINSLVGDASNPIDFGCATVFRYKFGSLQLLSKSNESVSLFMYLNPINYECLFDTNGDWKSICKSNFEEFINRIEDSFIINDDLTLGEEGDVKAYKACYASYHLWDYYMWSLMHPNAQWNDYFLTNGCKVFNNKPLLIQESYSNDDFVSLIYDNTINSAQLSKWVDAILFRIITNKQAYMRAYYLLTGEFPVFIPYLVGDRLRAPKWHISTDSEIQSYVEKVVTALIVLAAVVAATVIVGTAAIKISKKIKSALRAKELQLEAAKRKGVESAKQVNEDKSYIKKLKERIKQSDPNSEEYIALKTELNLSKTKLASSIAQFNTDNKSVGKADKALKRFKNLASKLGISQELVSKDTKDLLGDDPTVSTMNDVVSNEEIYDDLQSIKEDTLMVEDIYEEVTQDRHDVDIQLNNIGSILNSLKRVPSTIPSNR